MSREHASSLAEEEEQTSRRPDKIVIVENSDAREQHARDVADGKMTENLDDEPKGFWKKMVSGSFWKNTGKKIWKHNLWYDVYRQKEISKAKKAIGEGENANLFANEYGADRSHQQRVDKSLVDRFMAHGTETEKDMIHAAAGEKSDKLGDSGDEGSVKRSLQAAIKEYARGTMNEQQFLEHKGAVLARLKSARSDVLDKGTVYADNLLEMARWARAEVERQVAQSIDQAEALSRLDLDFDVVVGKAKAGVRTEAQFNAVDKIVDKIQSSWAGRWLSNDLTATAVAIAVSVASGATKATASVARKVGGFAGGILVGAGLGGLRESRRLEQERAQHAREKAQGKEVARPSKAERRKELEESRIQTRSAKELIQNLEQSLYVPGTKELKSLTGAEVKNIQDQIAEIDARTDISDAGVRNRDISKFRLFNKDKRYKVDLIGYSHITKVDEERKQLDVARATAKVKLRNLLTAQGVTTFDTDLQNAVLAKTNELMGGDKGIKAQNERFTKYKRAEVTKAVIKRIIIGGALGFAAREVKGLFDGRGVLPGMRPDGEVTPLGSLKSWWGYMKGEVPHTHPSGFYETDIDGHHVKFPTGVELRPDGHGGYNLLDDGKIVSDPAKPLHFDSSGHFDPDSKKFLTDHGFNPHETVASVAKGFQNADIAETKKLFPALIENKRVDWHDEPGSYWSEIHKKWLEFEGKQQMGYLVAKGDKVFLDCHAVINNFKENVLNHINSPDFGIVKGYFNPDGTPFVDPKMLHLKDQIVDAINAGELEKKFQAVIIPTDGANQEGLSDLIQGANTRGLIELNGAYNWSEKFIDPTTGHIDPKMLHDGHLPIRYAEMRFDGHVQNTAQGFPDHGEAITNLIDHPPTPNAAPDFRVAPPFPVVLAGRKPLEAMKNGPPPPPPVIPLPIVVSGRESGREYIVGSGGETSVRRPGKESKDISMEVVEKYFADDSDESKEEKLNLLQGMVRSKDSPVKQRKFRKEIREFYNWHKIAKRKKPFNPVAPEVKSSWTPIVEKAIPRTIKGKQRKEILHFVVNYLKEQPAASGNKKEHAADIVRLYRISK